MRSFRFAPVLALICVFAFVLAGCGGSNSVTPTPSGSPTVSRSTFAGFYEGSWQVTTESDNKISGRTTISGPAAITVSDNGTFSAVLENNTPYSYGVFSDVNRTHTFSGTVLESGYFTASVTVSETIKDQAVSTTNTISGSMVKPISGGERFRGTLGLTHSRVEIPGTLDVSRKN